MTENQNLENVEFKPVSPAVVYINGKKLTDASVLGEILIGNFLSQDENEYGKSYAFELVKDAELGDLGTIAAGEKIVLNGCSSVDRQMGEVEEGSLCRVSYDGKKVGKKGNSFHAFTIETA